MGVTRGDIHGYGFRGARVCRAPRARNAAPPASPRPPAASARGGGRSRRNEWLGSWMRAPSRRASAVWQSAQRSKSGQDAHLNRAPTIGSICKAHPAGFSEAPRASEAARAGSSRLRKARDARGCVQSAGRARCDLAAVTDDARVHLAPALHTPQPPRRAGRGTAGAERLHHPPAPRVEVQHILIPRGAAALRDAGSAGRAGVERSQQARRPSTCADVRSVNPRGVLGAVCPRG